MYRRVVLYEFGYAARGQLKNARQCHQFGLPKTDDFNRVCFFFHGYLLAFTCLSSNLPEIVSVNLAGIHYLCIATKSAMFCNNHPPGKACQDRY